MNTEHLVKILSAIHPLSDEFLSALEKELSPLSLPNHHYLVEAPKVADHAYFLTSGCAMSYIFIRGRKYVENFWLPGQIICSPRSFFHQTPSREFIQLMRDSDLLCISHNAVHRLLQSYSEASIIQRSTLIQFYEMEKERLRDSFLLDTPARHDKLLKSFPGIEQLFSQESIASYLGITPQTLSRLKKEGRP